MSINKDMLVKTCLSFRLIEEVFVLVGTLVDTVKEVLELKTEEIVPAPLIGAKYNSGFIEGMWRTDQNFIMILDIDKVFSTEEVLDYKEQIITQ